MRQIVWVLGILVFLMWGASSGLYALEAGLNLGTISGPRETCYGVSAGMGMLIPMVKVELEYYRAANAYPFPNTATAGLKFRPKFGALAPYVGVGIGAEFDRLKLKLGEYQKFSFIGGGLHLFLTSMISLRGDVRFLHFSGYRRTRISGGIFLHL
ncbi:MAG: hypothetical protein ACM3SY_09580 [Candidatus Omnitrophota bacterium]